MSRKYALPGTFVPGVTRKMDESGLIQLRDKKGRPLYNMPEPVGTHTTMQIVKKIVVKDGKATHIKVKEPVAFPVYRGHPAFLARSIRSNFRQSQRKLAAQQAANLARVESEDMNPAQFINSVLTPEG